MGTSTLLPLALGTGLSVLGQIQQGQQQNEYYKAQAKQSQLNAATAKADSLSQAEKIRRAGRYQVGETKAQLAASGVKLGEGTPLELEKDITAKAEEDAFATILTGDRAYTAGMTEAASLRSAAKNAKSNSVLSTGGTIAQGWYLGAKD